MKLVILDRDGVINVDSPDYIKNLEEWQPIAGSLAAIAKLTQAGYKVAVATNQSGMHRGLFSLCELDSIHQTLQSRVRQLGGCIDAIFFCPHQPIDDCDCRKPKTGLFAFIACFFQVNLENVPAIGDAWRDLEAAKKMGCQPILVRTGKGEHTWQQHRANMLEVPVYADLAEAVDYLIEDRI